MALRFHKRLKVFPGFYLNFSKSGMSASVGMKGMNVNIGSKGTYLNTSIAGTGLSSRTRLDSNSSDEGETKNNLSSSKLLSNEPEEIKSYLPALINSEGLFGLRDSIINAQKFKEELKRESLGLAKQKKVAFFLMMLSYISVIGIFIKWFKENYQTKKELAQDAEENYKNFKLDIEFNMDDAIMNDYLTLKNCYEQLMNIQMIWDITTTQSVDRAKERSAAGTHITRTKVKFSKSSLDFISTKYEALKLQNANGGDIFIYPGFLVMTGKDNKDFALIDFREIKIKHYEQRFIERDSIPKDSKIVDYSWEYANKDGSQDKRKKDNYQNPVALYYEILLETSKGLYECYEFSNADIGRNFCISFEKYQMSLNKMKWKNDEPKELDTVKNVEENKEKEFNQATSTDQKNPDLIIPKFDDSKTEEVVNNNNIPQKEHNKSKIGYFLYFPLLNFIPWINLYLKNKDKKILKWTILYSLPLVLGTLLHAGEDKAYKLPDSFHFFSMILYISSIFHFKRIKKDVEK